MAFLTAIHKYGYAYDALHRLRIVRDHDGNLVKSFDTNFDKY